MAATTTKANIAPGLREAGLVVPLDDVQPYDRNPRRGVVDRIAESLQAHGQYKPLTVNGRTGDVLAGNHTWRAAKQLGWSEVARTLVDVDDDEAARIVLVDNRLSDVATYDDEALAELLGALADSDAGLAGTGWTDEDLAALLPPDERPALTDEDDVPDRGDEPSTITRPGTLWLLGDEHRLLCGDATKPEDVDRLLDGAVPDAVWTDPPYGVDYVGKTSDALRIQNDNLDADGLRLILEGAFANIARVLRPGGVFYVCSPPGPLETDFRVALRDHGLDPRQQLVWVKDRFVLGHSDYHQRHEPILHGWVAGADPMTPPLYDQEHATVLYGWKPGAGHDFHGGRKQDTVWHFPRPSASKLHPTMKPVGLVRRGIENSTRPGELVWDLFGGSGSTIIAGYASRRRTAVLELDRVYVDVICRRWQEHTGIAPVDAATGEPVDFTGGP